MKRHNASERPRLIIDALQMPSSFSGVGRQLIKIGHELAGVTLPIEAEVRCPRDVAGVLREAFPRDISVRPVLPRSRPRVRRYAYQHVLCPLKERGKVLLLCPGDQAPLLTRARVLLVVHDVRRLTHPETAGFLEARFYRFLVPRSISRAWEVATVSEFSRHEVERAAKPRGSVRVVAVRPPLRLTIDGQRTGPLLTVGALRRYKGVDTLIEALALLESDERPRVTCVGSGEDQLDRLRSLARERAVEDWVDFAGWVPDSRLEHLYRTSTAVVSPSRYEGYGLPVAESISYGAPTIASDIPPHREIAGTAIVYFRPGDAGDLAHKLRLVTTDPALQGELSRRSAARARDLQSEGLTWAELILEACERLLREENQR